MTVSLLGQGLYSVADAARLTGATTSRIRRWLRGYRYSHDARQFEQPAVWTSKIPRIDGRLTLSFNDLMEVRFVQAFRELGISLQKIRRAVAELQRMTQSDYPFSQRRVVTDGAELFAVLEDAEGNPLLLELTEARNFAFYSVIYPMLQRGLIFDERGRVERWYPDIDRFSHIELNPRVCFGHPVVEGTRIQPQFLARALQIERSIERVADWYEIDPALVEQAAEFNRQYLM